MNGIIGVIQVKGGCGRSTLATNLAGYFSAHHRTALIDADMPQGTSSSWGAIRQQAGKANNLTIATAPNHQALVNLVAALSNTNDYVLIDCPPRIAEMTRAALILSDLCLVPLGASAADIWATSDLLTTINEAKAVKQGIDARIVWNRFRSTTSSAKELSASVRKGLGLAELRSKVGLRIAYSDALARGQTALEWTDKNAKIEMQELGKEVAKILKPR